MFRFLPFLALITTLGLASDQKSAQPVTLTFYLTGVECSACSELIHQAVQKVPTVSDYAPYELGIVNISFDANAVTPHQIAQAIYEAFPAHGKPYEAALHFRVRGYAEGTNATRLEAVFSKYRELVKVELIDKAKGEFAAQFLPIKTESTKASERKGWTPDLFFHAIHDPSPQGLGLDFELIEVGQQK